eukprot:457792-Amphidinium_carterae.1
MIEKLVVMVCVSTVYTPRTRTPRMRGGLGRRATTLGMKPAHMAALTRASSTTTTTNPAITLI